MNQKTCPDYKVEIVVFDDASSDDTVVQILEWKAKFKEKDMELVLVESDSAKPKGGKLLEALKSFSSSTKFCVSVGYGRNVAVSRSSGDWLCFQDVDDVMMRDRIQKQLEAGLHLGNNFVSSIKS